MEVSNIHIVMHSNVLSTTIERERERRGREGVESEYHSIRVSMFDVHYFPLPVGEEEGRKAVDKVILRITISRKQQAILCTKTH
jgi:hypothetical protein